MPRNEILTWSARDGSDPDLHITEISLRNKTSVVQSHIEHHHRRNVTSYLANFHFFDHFNFFGFYQSCSPQKSGLAPLCENWQNLRAKVDFNPLKVRRQLQETFLQLMLKGWTNLIYFLTNVLFKAKFGSTARTSMLAEEIQRDAEMSDRNYVFSCTGNCIPTFVVGGCIFRCVFVSGRNYGCLHQIFLQLWLQFAKLSVQVTLHHCSGIYR